MAKNPVDTLLDNLYKANIAEDLDVVKQDEIAGLVKRGYERDEESRIDWRKQTEEGIKIAEQVIEEKSYPWPKAANVKYPLIAISAIQFAARAYPSIIQGNKVVKCDVIGKDVDNSKSEKARRVSTHMSWQLIEQMQGWDQDTDKLLHVLPVVGTVFRKTYRDELNQVNASELCMPLDLVVHMDTKNFLKCRRKTHLVPLYKNEVIERERNGLFLDKGADYFVNDTEEDQAEIFLEQHRWLDLDEDGYEEPYVVTVHKDSGKLVRIVACYDADGINLNDDGEITKITAVSYFTDYHFIPASSGKFYSLGFAHLLGSINETLSTSINMLLDAGHMATVGGGFFGKGIRMRGGSIRFAPNEWKPLDIPGGTLRDNIVPLPVPGPSPVLFQLLGMLNEMGMKLASVSDQMAGESPSQNTPATTTLAVLEQGLKVFTAIYKRIFRSLKAEFEKLRRLNGIYLDEEEVFRVLDEEQAVFRNDYKPGNFDVTPVADPSMASDAQRLAKAQAMLQTISLNPTPGGRLEILEQYYNALQVPNMEKLIPRDEKGNIQMPQPPPDPDVLELQLKTTESMNEEDRKRAKLPYELKEIEARIDELKARTQKYVADVESQPIMNQLQTLTQMVQAIQKDTELEIKREQMKQKGATDGRQTGNPAQSGAGRPAGMVPAEGDAGSVDVPGAEPLGDEGYAGGGLQFEQLAGEDGAGDGLDGGPGQGTQPYPDGTRRS